MKRRYALKTFGCVGAWALTGLELPRLIGEAAGGFYAPVPDNIEPLLTWGGWASPLNQAVMIRNVSCGAVWAPPGSTLNTLAEFAGSMTATPAEMNQPRLIEAKRQNLLRSVRECLQEHHEPGWFKATETRATVTPAGYDEDGDPYFYEIIRVWRRAGYVRWVNFSDLAKELVA